jgi:hypothetical protein
VSRWSIVIVLVLVVVLDSSLSLFEGPETSRIEDENEDEDD